jgi:hypothetical protein
LKNNDKTTFWTLFVTMAVIATCGLVACTENQQVAELGGHGTINVAPGQRVVGAVFDHDDDLWILTRPLLPDETPTTFTLTEKSKYGMLEGSFELQESR